MRICCISDTHGKEPLSLPKGDILIHCGDFSTFGNVLDTSTFNQSSKNYNKFKYRLLISGNHDWQCYENRYIAEGLLDQWTYLQDSEIVIRGVKFYGTPWSPPFMDWAFMKPEEELEKIYSNIPLDTDVLISHCPPYGILDLVNGVHQGSKALMKRVGEVRPRVHLFGHLHSSSGQTRVDKTLFVNCSLLNDNYEDIFKPTIIEL